jgi:flagellar protein FliS
MTYSATARQHYSAIASNGRVEGASAHGLVMIMFDELCDALAQIGHAIAAKQAEQKSRTAAKATAILHALRMTLDHKRGGQIAADLDAIYDYATREVALSATSDDADRLQRTSTLVAEIASAWREIGR